MSALNSKANATRKTNAPKCNLFPSSRIFRRRSPSVKRSPIQLLERKMKPCFSCDCPPDKSSDLFGYPASWTIEGDTEDELLFILPNRPRSKRTHSDGEDDELRSDLEDEHCQSDADNLREDKQQNESEDHLEQFARKDTSYQEEPEANAPKRTQSIRPITTQTRLMRTQNVWCIPNLSRAATESLLADADPGNFILRVSQTQHAMVLSRRVLGSSSDMEQTSNVDHNIIEVFPRSGYCLTGDRQVHLIFGSLIEMLTFYIRVSRSRATGGPFLRLPRSVLDAQTLGDLELINKQGVDFWTNTFSRIPRATGLGHGQPNSRIDAHSEPSVTRIRPSSVDRWTGHKENSSVTRNHEPEISNYRGQGHRSRLTGPTDMKRIEPSNRPRRGSHRALRSSSVHTASYDPCQRDTHVSQMTYAFEPACYNAQSAELARVNGLSKVWDQVPSRPIISGRQLESPTGAGSYGRMHANERCRGARTGVYESSDGELWCAKTPSSLEKLPYRQHPTPPSMVREIPRGSAPISRPLLGPAPNLSDQSSCSTRGKLSTESNNNHHSHESHSNGVLSGTLDEHLRSGVSLNSHKNALKTGSSMQPFLSGAHAPPDNPNTNRLLNNTPSMDLSNTPWNNASSHSSQYDAAFTWSEGSSGDLVGSRSLGSSVPLASRSDEASHEKKSDKQSNSRLTGFNQTGQIIELPAPKTVGCVFAMEATTYSSDDYDPSCDSTSGKPRLGRFPAVRGSSVKTPGQDRTTNKLDDSNEICIGIGRPRLRRAMTVRDSDRSFTGPVPPTRPNAMDDIEPQRRHGKFLEDLITWRESDRQNSGTVVNNGSIDSHDDMPSRLTNSTVPSNSHLHHLIKVRMRSVENNAENEETREQGGSMARPTDPQSQKTTPILTLLAAPRTSNQPTTEDTPPLCNWDPPPPPEEPPPPLVKPEEDCDPPSDKPGYQLQQQLSETSNLSPSPSSRASTVFCPPWDTAPMGLYLSDLINLTRPLAGSVGGNGSTGRTRDSLVRRRTLSTLEHRLLNERLLALNDANNGNCTELHKLLNIWLQANPTDRAEKEAGSSDEAPPPPLPQRRRRVRGHRMNTTGCSVTEDVKSRDVKPYAIVDCPVRQKSTESREPELVPEKQSPSQFEQNDSFGVYDEAFIGQDTGSPDPKESTRTSPRPTMQETTSHVKAAPISYVYAKVVPHHLRQRPQGSKNASPEPYTTNEQGSMADRIAKFQGKPIMTAPRSVSSTMKSRSGHESTEQINLDKAPDSDVVTHSPPISPVTYSSSSEDDDCARGNNDVQSGANSLPQRSASTRPMDDDRRERREPGRHIRHFVHKLFKSKNSKVAEQVNLFLECTREGSDRGPYRIMQSIRQFINGMTNYLLRNPDLGLPAAVELEKRNLPEFGFLNVGALLESTLQNYILRPLYRHVIRLLKQEQIKHNELDPVRVQVQWAWATPAQNILANEGYSKTCSPASIEALVDQVTQLFRRMERTYSIGCKVNYLADIFDAIRNSVQAPQEEIHTSNTRIFSFDGFEPVYAWVFARAGLLLAPLVAEHWNQPKPWANRQISVFCPAALQADYLEGLMHKSQLRDQAKSQSCLNDLFSTLYWIWSRATDGQYTRNSADALSLSRPQPSGSQPELDSTDTLGSTLSKSGMRIPVDGGAAIGSHTSDKDDCDNSDLCSGSMATEGYFGSTKRRIIPPRRRKTITGLQWTKTSGQISNELQSGSPLASTKFSGSFKSNMLHQNGSVRPMNLMSSQDVLTSNSSPGALPRWRPWVPQTASQVTTPNDLSSHERAHQMQTAVGQSQPQQQLRVLVMDENSNQLRYQSYPLRPNLTVNELSNMIAFKMKIFDPKEFSLFAYVNGKEHALDDSFHLADFCDTSFDFHGSQMTLPGRSATGTLNSVRDLSNQLLPQTGKHSSAFSVSSRSCSPTSSSNDSQTHLKRFARVSSRTAQTTNPWWILCKKFSSGSPGTARTGPETEMVGPAPTAFDVINISPLVTNRPLLIFRRTNGFFAISDRLLQCLGD